MSLRYSGNVNFFLTACDASQANCEKSKVGGRIYPGKSFKVTAKNGAFKLQRVLFSGGKDVFTINQASGTRKFAN